MTRKPLATNAAPLLRESWIPVFGSAFRLAMVLAVFAAAVRGFAMLGPPRYLWVLPLGFIIMALTPYLLFSGDGRRRAGLRLPRRSQWILWGIPLGPAASVVLYGLGAGLFGESPDNWYVSVRRSFPITPEMASLPTADLFWIISIFSMIFSPLGEEIFFRGFLQQAAEERWNYCTAVLIDAGCCAIAHLFHHGILRIDGRIQLFPLSGTIWMALIFGTGVMFTLLRQKTDSLVAPILSHATFNLGMNFTIPTGCDRAGTRADAPLGVHRRCRLPFAEIPWKIWALRSSTVSTVRDGIWELPRCPNGSPRVCSPTGRPAASG